MTRSLLTDAANGVETARANAADPEVRDRLALLSDRLHSQATRETTPALGVLDRISTKLRGIERQTDDPAVAEPIERARGDVLSFLETLDDRGMEQHAGE